MPVDSDTRLRHSLLMDTPESTPSIRADKSFGQHFLHEAGVIEKILRFAAPLEDRHVLEIGPGPGALTRALLKTDISSLTAVEIDPRMLPGLEALREASAGKLTVLHRDALELDLTTLTPAPRAVVANLPYNVATPLLIGWLETIHAQGPTALERLTLMFQKEVAQRIAAAPGSKDYGRLAVLSQWLCRVEYGFDISPGCFTPPPKVTSAVIRLTPYPAPLFPAQKDALQKVLAAGFNQRRKMLRSALKCILPQPETTLMQLEIDPTRRAETLSVEEWCRLSYAIA